MHCQRLALNCWTSALNWSVPRWQVSISVGSGPLNHTGCTWASLCWVKVHKAHCREVHFSVLPELVKMVWTAAAWFREGRVIFCKWATLWGITVFIQNLSWSTLSWLRQGPLGPVFATIHQFRRWEVAYAARHRRGTWEALSTMWGTERCCPAPCHCYSPGGFLLPPGVAPTKNILRKSTFTPKISLC